MHPLRTWAFFLCLIIGIATAAAAAPIVSPDTVPQGGLVRVAHPIPEDRQVTKASLTFNGSTTRCFPYNGAVVGLLAVGARTRAGKHPIILEIEYSDGLTERSSLPVTVTAGNFPTQRIRMPRSKTGLMSDTVLEKERRILYGAMEKTATEPLWEGVFINPLEGRISSPFGRARYVNGRFWGQHSGLDVASPSGRPVRAANSGRILVARKLWMRGNTVMIDHGLGVFSLYNHLSRIDVQPGQAIDKGEIIGLVGATGFVTGPHLHWELRVFRTPTNPAGPLAVGIPLSGA